MKEIGGVGGVYKWKWPRMDLSDYTLTICFPFLRLLSVLIGHYLRHASYP